ncbi:MAG: hypothetical protein CSA51_04040, partial [Gammaproteobacteria bacterium]
LPHLVSGLDIIELTAKHKGNLNEMTALYFAIANILNARWLAHGINALYDNDYWRRRACHSLMDNLKTNLVTVTEQAAALGLSTDKAIPQWRKKYAAHLQSYLGCLAEITQENVDLSRLSVAIGEMSALARSE